jgi:oligoendopeptidase F
MSLPFHSLDAALAPSPASVDLGQLPEWRLEDLYEDMDSPRFAADLERAEREAKLFAETWRGKLSEFVDRPDAGETLAAAVKAYESMQDLTGRIMAYASLLYASDTSDSGRAKFYGDAHERVTALASPPRAWRRRYG